ncbi:MAG: 3-hydroxy-9,10-secoandrosta-1,3,5(10)-triene-9,17-dione monooxygenase reductase subunit, partial [Nocardioidaceae bacterium]
ETWPSQELIDSWLGQFDFELGAPATPVPGDDPEAEANARKFRDVLGRFCTGVTVVTSMSGGRPVGMTCQSFSSVSLDPPLVLFCPAKGSRAWPLIQRAGFFCVNLLSHDQLELSNGFAAKGADKFAGVSWRQSATGAPLLDGVLGWVDCTIYAVHEAGDHYVVIGRVMDLDVEEAPHPLLFYRGQYARTQA